MCNRSSCQRRLITPLILVIIALFATNVQGEGDIDKGRKKAVACQVCHGKGGKSKNPTYPRLAGQHAKYIVKQLKAFKSGTRKDPIMNNMAATLTSADMEDVAAFFASNSK